MSFPSSLTSATFGDFFKALWGYDPFPWQQEFARRMCEGQPPDYVTVPTGSGKTACLDAAVFALAFQASWPVAERTAGRRIFFVVNRRIIVDEAFVRAKHLAKKLRESLEQDVNQTGIIAQVALALKRLAGNHAEEPLACAELRGGIYRDRAWAKSIVQPMILCSTVDQAGSRLLFRGYGVSDEARPIHAALVAHDSLLLIDEAHISQPFLQTLDWVRRYRVHQPLGSETVALPFSIVRMTATPPRANTATLLELTDQDREHPVFKRRLIAAKPVRLVRAAKAKGKNAMDELVKVLEAEASTLIAQEPRPKSIAIMVNRVQTARDLTKLLAKKHCTANVTLLIGRMRPLDRDQVTRELQAVLKTGVKHVEDSPLHIIVSTQCLEVGADLDFDALVTECASLDALRQRFGRLNRDGRPITAQGVIVMPEEQCIEESKLDENKLADPIYGNAIPRTWRWLESQLQDGSVNFGLHAMTEAVRSTDEEGLVKLLMPRANAPILLPAYLDCWVQTNPRPAADPDVALFLQGPQRDMAEVQVCWRADLPDDDHLWAETLALCPPTALECLPVPLHLMRQWLENGDGIEDGSGDAPASTIQNGAQKDGKKREATAKVKALLWIGEESSFISSPATLGPGQTIVLRAQDGGWDSLGHVPNATTTTIDRAEEGQAKLRRRAFVRLHEDAFWPVGDKDSPAGQLKEWAMQAEFDWRSAEAKQALIAVANSLVENNPRAVQLGFVASAKRLEVEPYPDGRGVVFTVRKLLPPSSESETGTDEDGPGDPLLNRLQTQSLEAHTKQVTELTIHYTNLLGLKNFADPIQAAARLHDIGKADPRFQAMLIQGTLSAGYAQSVLWAKSDSIPGTAAARERARKRAELPKGFRHETLSMQIASLPAAKASLPESETRAALVLHLIASHHGHARPLAPIVFDDEPLPIEMNEQGMALVLSAAARRISPAHAIDSGIAERFWRLTRLHGWWGLALLETVLRLADQTASSNPENPTKK